MQGNRVFTNEELKDMGKRNVDAVTEAMDAGDLARARDLLQRMHRESVAMRDGLVSWITALLSFVGRRYGDEALYEALREGCRGWIVPLVEAFAQADARRRAVLMAKVLRGHMVPIRIEEDDEKFTFIMEPCGSGGRLVSEGGYQPPRNFLRVEKAQPLTLGCKDFPVYCCHHHFEEVLPQEMTGCPLFITEPAENIGEEPCRMYLYKDPRAAPRR